MSVTTCRSCDAPIRWARTGSGAFMPIDAEPNPDGNIEIHDGTVIVHAQPPLIGAVLWMPHWKTCPDGDKWRGTTAKT